MDRNLSGIVLSGGRSSRMGQDKGLMDFQGRKLIEHVLEQLKKVAREIWIVSNHTIEAYEALGFQVVSDHYQDKGPIGGIHAGLSAITNEAAFVLSCDTPYLNEGFLRYLKMNYRGEDVLMPVHDENKFEPLCSIYNKSIILLLEERIKQNSLKMNSLINDKTFSSKTLRIDNACSYYYPDIFKNINSKEDLDIHEEFSE